MAPTAVQYWARDLASDYQYHGRQQEASRIARIRLLYSEKASQRRDERPQDASSHHRCCGPSGDRHVKRCSGVVASTGRSTAKTLTSAAPTVLGVNTAECLSRPPTRYTLACILQFRGYHGSPHRYRMLRTITAAVVVVAGVTSSVTHTILASTIRRGINERSHHLDWEGDCKDLDERGPDCFRRQYRMPQQTFDTIRSRLYPAVSWVSWWSSPVYWRSAVCIFHFHTSLCVAAA